MPSRHPFRFHAILTDIQFWVPAAVLLAAAALLLLLR
jgi:hypothetical protein